MNTIMPQTIHQTAESVLSELGGLYIPKDGWFEKLPTPATLDIEYEPFSGSFANISLRISSDLYDAIPFNSGFLVGLREDLLALIRRQKVAKLLKKPVRYFQVKRTGRRRPRK